MPYEAETQTSLLEILTSLPFSFPFLDGALSPGFPPSEWMRSAEEIDTFASHIGKKKLWFKKIIFPAEQYAMH